jgi:hypothetical protein
MSTQRGYTELMAPAFIEGLADPAALIEEGNNFWERYMAAQQAIRAELEQVDWESSGLPGRIFGDEYSYVQAPKSPREFANYLLTFAFDDTLLPMQFTEALVKEAGIEMPMGPLLRASRNNLLLFSRMPDENKGRLFAIIKHRTNPTMHDVADAFGHPEFTGNPLIIDESSGAPILDWQPAIKEYIEDWMHPLRGCPAHKYPVHDNGKNISLINYFWDRLTQILYPEE